MTVPPPGGLTTASVPPAGLGPVAQADQPRAARGVGAALAVVRDLDPHDAVLARHGHPAPASPRRARVTFVSASATM